MFIIIIVLDIIIYKLYLGTYGAASIQMFQRLLYGGSNHPPEEMVLAVELATDDNPQMRRWLIAGLDEVK